MYKKLPFYTIKPQFFRFLVILIVTASTSPPIGGFSLLTLTVALDTNASSLKIRFKIRCATVSNSLEAYHFLNNDVV